MKRKQGSDTENDLTWFATYIKYTHFLTEGKKKKTRFLVVKLILKCCTNLTSHPGSVCENEY